MAYITCEDLALGYEGKAVTEHIDFTVTSHDHSDSRTITEFRICKIKNHIPDMIMFNQMIGFLSYLFRIVMIQFPR